MFSFIQKSKYFRNRMDNYTNGTTTDVERQARSRKKRMKIREEKVTSIATALDVTVQTVYKLLEKIHPQNEDIDSIENI